VNVDGIRHVGIYNATSNQAEIAQMIGRCARQKYGIWSLFGMSPTTRNKIAQSIPSPKKHATRVLVFWWALKKAYAP
jgi:hypothetical protein